MRGKEQKTRHELEMLPRDRTKDLPVDRLKRSMALASGGGGL